MGTFILFHSEAGLVLPADRRQRAAADAFPYLVDTSIAGDYEWHNNFVSEVDSDHAPVIIREDGATVLRAFDGEISYSKLELLRSLIKHADAGGVCTLSEENGPLPLTTLYVCNGDGTATVHEAVTVFPTYAGAASGMADANQEWEQALEDKGLTLDLMGDLAPDHVPESWTAAQDLASIENALPELAARHEAAKANHAERVHDALCARGEPTAPRNTTARTASALASRLRCSAQTRRSISRGHLPLKRWPLLFSQRSAMVGQPPPAR